MNTLDIIKYISIRPKNRKVLSIISLPIAVETPLDHHTYYYDITNEKHISFINKIVFNLNLPGANSLFPHGSIPGYSAKCIIHTVFGEVYKGRIVWLLNLSVKKCSRNVLLDVTSDERMGYAHNYYLRSKNSNKRFAMMEV